jgi:polygalacturonase
MLVFLTGLAGAGGAPATQQFGAEAMPPQIAPIKAPFDMPPIQRPMFPDRVVDIRDHGAVADGKTLNTTAIANAIAACAQRGGGRVLVPAGVWLSGAIHLRSNIDLHLEKGAVLRFSTNPHDYLPVVFTRWAGFECYNYSPLIYARGCRNIAVTGPGRLDGQAASWGVWCKRQNEMAQVLIDLGRRGVPQFISPIDCKNVLIEGISVNGGPFWTIHCVYCENLIVRGVTVRNFGPGSVPNNDGVDVDSCQGALVEYCTLDTTDDCICLKSGINEDGWRVGRPAENVVIRYCRTAHGHGGVVIGSDTSGGVRNVLAHDCIFDGTLMGIRLKSARGRGGIVEHVWLRDIAMSNIERAAISVNAFYKAWAAGDAGKPPLFRDIHIQNVTCNRAGTAVELTGLPEQPIENVSLEQLSLAAKTGFLATDVRGLHLSHVKIAAGGSAFQFDNCREVTQEGSKISPGGSH